MVNHLMVKVRFESGISPEFIAINRSPFCNVLFHDRVQGFASPVWNYLSPHLSLIAVKHSHYYHFVSNVVALSADSAGLDRLVHVAGFPADECFVYLNFFSTSTKFHCGLSL